MARINHVKRAQKEHKCGRCGDTIEKGQPYIWVKPSRFDSKKVRCVKVTCKLRNSETVSNEKISQAYEVQETAQDELETWTGDDGSIADLEAILQTASEGAQEVVDMFDESISNLEDAFPGGTPAIDEQEERKGEVESWVDELDSAISDLEDFDEDTAKQEVYDEDFEDEWTERVDTGFEGFIKALDTGQLDPATAENFTEGVNDKRREWADEQREKAEAAIDALTL